MINQLGHITLLVRDQDEALRFYVDTLGFEKRMDATFGPGMRWVTIAPKGERVALTLVKADTDEKLKLVGRQVADHVLLVVHTDDCRKDYETLKARGVNFIDPPNEQPYGVEALFKDLYGNVFDLLQPL